MPFNLRLPGKFRSARWKVKIREKETREPPHVTILRGVQAWRIGLRSGEFMDRVPDPSEVPEELVNWVKRERNWKRLCSQWDLKYPANPVSGAEEEGEEGE